MGLDRGVLANLDRRLLAEFDSDERSQMVRLPISAAMWLTWKRLCAVAGISMGRGIVALIDRELASVADEADGDDSSLLTQLVSARLATREASIAGREMMVAATEEKLRVRSEQLRRWEAELQALSRAVDLVRRLPAQRRVTSPRAGRNDRCPCGSGLKYESCYGLAGR